jgi:hypothetical protein
MIPADYLIAKDVAGVFRKADKSKTRRYAGRERFFGFNRPMP